MAAEDETPAEVLEEPRTGDDTNPAPSIWMRGVFMIILAILFGVGEFVLIVATVLQFFWMLFAKERNAQIADFGKDLSDWLARTARFQTGVTDDKPFPFAPWGREGGREGRG